MGVRERWIGWRNARLSDPRFQRRAARLPLVRRLVRKQSAALFDTVAAFVYSQILAACIELDLFARIASGIASARELADEAQLAPEAMLRLLRGGAALDLFEELDDGRFALGMQGAALLGNPGIAAMVRHHRILYADLADPVALLRAGRGRLAEFWAYREDADAQAAAAYSALMAASQPMVCEQVLAAHDFGRHRHLLDVGGGDGAFLEMVGERYPRLALSLFDLPAVADRAAARLGTRATIHRGSFVNGELPQGCDAISLIRILHDHDDGPAQALLTRIASALPAGGTLIIGEPLADTPGARAMGDGYFGFYLLAMGSGRPRRADEIGAMLTRAGFARWKLAPTPLPLIASVIVATR